MLIHIAIFFNNDNNRIAVARTMLVPPAQRQ